MRGLEALNELKKQNDFLKKKGTPLEYRYDNELIIIEKELKALEIMRNDTHIYNQFGRETICVPFYDNIYTSKEKFELLKEVLTSDKTTIN